MKDETIAKIKEETEGWAYMAALPEEWHGFTLKREPVIGKDKYDLYAYVNEEWHKSAIVYFHEETHEYKVRLKIGLIEFARIEFITAKLSVFEELLTAQSGDSTCRNGSMVLICRQRMKALNSLSARQNPSKSTMVPISSLITWILRW